MAKDHGRPDPITMIYRNYRGEIGERRIIPKWVWFAATQWHPEPGWLLHAFDTEKGVARDFALADCQFADLCASGQQVRAVEMAENETDAEWIEDACQIFDTHAQNLGWARHIYSEKLRALFKGAQKVLPLIEAAGREEVTDNRDWDEAEAMIRAALDQSN